MSFKVCLVWKFELGFRALGCDWGLLELRAVFRYTESSGGYDYGA